MTNSGTCEGTGEITFIGMLLVKGVDVWVSVVVGAAFDGNWSDDEVVRTTALEELRGILDPSVILYLRGL